MPKNYKEMWGAYDVPRHLWHFSPSVMQQFGAKHDFILCERHPMPFDAFYVSMLSEKYRKKCFPVHKRPDYRSGSMDCFTGQERPEQFHDLCIQKKIKKL